jgi:hypothetical protein
VLSQKWHSRGKLSTFWPTNLQISGGREVAFTVVAAAAAPAFDADGLILMTSWALHNPLEILSLSGCPDGRTRFAGGLGRGCSNPLDGPSLLPEGSEPAVVEGEAGAVEFSIEVSIIVAGRFRLCILRMQERL